MVAHGHGIVAECVHHLGGDLSLVPGVEKGPLELIPRVDEQRVRRIRPRRPDGRGQAGIPAEAFSGRVVLGRTVAVILVDRLDPGMEIVRVQDCQSLGVGTGGKEQRNNGGQEAF